MKLSFEPARWTGRKQRNPACGAALIMLALLSVPYLAFAGESGPLSLPEAERIALDGDPSVAASLARSEALEEDAVADGQLPDPKLRTGLYNLPLDSFDVRQEPTTQLRVGIQQAIPRGDTLRYSQARTRERANAETAKAGVAANRAVRSVRETFLEIHYQLAAARIVLESLGLFTGLVDITESQYGAGLVSQQDVLRAQLELSQLDDRITRIRNAEEAARANLSRWIEQAAWRPLASGFPKLPPLPPRDALESALERHPEIAALSARIASHQQAVHVAREQYKPGWGLGVEYRKRFGDNPDGSSRTDMAAVMLTVDLPLFTENRQDRRLAASQKQADAAHLDRTRSYRELRRTLALEYANWTRLGEREALFETRLVKEAQSNADASLNAYQSGISEFTTLMRARITELDIRLKALRVRVDRAKAQARLLYLIAGELQ